MTPDARVLRFPSAASGTGVRDYDRFTRELSPDELAGCFFFTDDDRRRIATRRGDASRLGFAVQLGTVRYLGRFLEDPADVPASVLGWTIREIAVGADTSLEGYGEGEARWEHQAEIRRAYGYRPFGDQGVEDELVLWLRARAWISAESHRVLFTRAAEHLTARRILLPGYTTLWRLVGSACEHADARGFAMLADTPTSEQRDRLAGLLQTPAGRRLSVLERLRRPEVEPTIGGLINGLARVQELRELADGLGGLDALPVARLRALMVDAERCRAADIAKMSDARRTATLMAFAITATERGQDDARASLLGDAAWDASRADTQRSLSLPAQPGPFLEQLGGELDDAYRRTRQRLTPEHPIHELATGGLRVEQLDALPEPATLTTLRERVDALLPAADLPDLVLEIAAKTGFIDAFTNDQEPGAKLDGLATSLCAVLVAQACNVGYKPLVDESNPALREARLRYVAQRYLRPETLAAANARIVDVHAKLPLAERWGGGEVASIDGLRFVVPRRTIHAAYNRRYFDRRRGVTLLGTTADHYAGLHTVVITGTQPDAPYILDGLLDPQTSVRPREIMTDTAGYTDVIFGLFRLLGYQYSPRLADAGGATFWRINPTDYGPLNGLARHQVNARLIEQHYDDLLRVAGSLLQRHTTASQLVRALRSHTRHLASLARALQHVGRAAKTIHLLDYCNDQPFRRRILTQLNRGESRHALARDVCHGYRGELRQRYRQGQEEQLGALGLIVNAIVLYNTIYTQRALDHLAGTGPQIDDVEVERLSPLGSDHLTLTGRYRIALAEALRDRSAYRELNAGTAVAA